MGHGWATDLYRYTHSSLMQLKNQWGQCPLKIDNRANEISFWLKCESFRVTQLPCSTCFVDTGVAPERMRRAHDSRLAPAYNKRRYRERGWVGGIMRSSATPVSTTQVEQGSCNMALLRMTPTWAKNKSHWFRSFLYRTLPPLFFMQNWRWMGQRVHIQARKDSLNDYLSRVKRHF